MWSPTYVFVAYTGTALQCIDLIELSICMNFFSLSLSLQVSLFLHRVPTDLGSVTPMEQCWSRTRQPAKFQETPSESSGNDSSESDTAEEEEEDGWESGEFLEIS